MMDFRVTIRNGGKCLIYDKIIHARDENKALQELIEKVAISTDDTIKIKEISEEEKIIRLGIAKLSSLVKDFEKLSKLTESYDESKLLKDLESKLIDISSTLVEYETKERGLEELEV